eukprot:COSAG02_NODE_26_length_51927_cov_61.213881_20_plen_162_part_00
MPKHVQCARFAHEYARMHFGATMPRAGSPVNQARLWGLQIDCRSRKSSSPVNCMGVQIESPFRAIYQGDVGGLEKTPSKTPLALSVLALTLIEGIRPYALYQVHSLVCVLWFHFPGVSRVSGCQLHLATGQTTTWHVATCPVGLCEKFYHDKQFYFQPNVS